MKDQRGSSLGDDLGGQRQAPAILPLGMTRYPRYRGWMGPRAGLDDVEIHAPHRDSIP